MQRKQEVWTFGGGKGGVGKSLLCSNVALYLSQKRFKVLLVDADFGAANLHTYIGQPYTKKSLSDFLLGQDVSLEDVIVETPYSNLYIIPGGEDPLKISNPRFFQIHKLTAGIEKLDFDYVLIDLSAGTTAYTVDLFAVGKKALLVTLPEPAAVENTYRFLKYSFLRRFRLMVMHPEVRKFLDIYLSQKNNEVFYSPQDLIELIAKMDYETSLVLQNFMQSFTPKLLMNVVHNSTDIKIGFAMCRSSSKYFGINLHYVGFVERDPRLAESVRKRVPIVYAEPFSKSSRGIKRICEALLQSK